MAVDSVRHMRQITRVPVVGSALGLHASAVAGVGDGILRSDHPLPDREEAEFGPFYFMPVCIM